MNKIIRTKKEFIESMKLAPKNSTLIWDEGGLIIDNSKHLDAINKQLNLALKNMEIQRRKNLPILFNIY